MYDSLLYTQFKIQKGVTELIEIVLTMALDFYIFREIDAERSFFEDIFREIPHTPLEITMILQKFRENRFFS